MNLEKRTTRTLRFGLAAVAALAFSSRLHWGIVAGAGTER